MKRLLIALAAVALLTGCGVAAEATPAPMKTLVGTPAATHEIQEDEPGWDCWTMGSKTCGANPLERTEAWGAFQTSSVSKELLTEAFRVTYYGIANEGVDFPPSKYVTIKSGLTAGKIHVFLVERIPA